MELIEDIAPKLPNICERPFSEVKTYELETAQQIYNWLKYELGTMPSIQATLPPNEYLKNAEKEVAKWDEWIEKNSPYPDEYKKPQLENFLSYYMMYMRALADQDNYV